MCNYYALCTIDWQHQVCSWTQNYYNFISKKDEKPWKDLISCVIIMHCALCTIDWQHQVCSWTQNYSCVIIMHCALCTIDWQHKVCSWTLNYYNFIWHKDEKPWKDIISCVIIMHCAKYIVNEIKVHIFRNHQSVFVE